MAAILPFVLGATAVMNIINRNNAAAQANTAQQQERSAAAAQSQAELAQIPSEGQVQGAEVQGLADRGINLGPAFGAGAGASPAVQYALSRRQNVINKIQAGETAQQAGFDLGIANQRYAAASSGGDPFQILMGLFSGGGSATAGGAGAPTGPFVPVPGKPAMTTSNVQDPWGYTA